jgi:hypothetical protein
MLTRFLPLHLLSTSVRYSSTRLPLFQRCSILLPRRLPLRSLHHSAQLKMNVTKANFPTVVSELERLLPTASFVAIDEEMTGISIPGCEREKMDDTTEQRYQKMRAAAEHYKIIQIGLCLFHEVKEDASAAKSGQPSIPRFCARPYNFYLFPEEGQINMEAEAIAFNKQHGMDFNKWIYEGIPYVTEESHKALISKFYGDEEGWKKEQVRAGKLKPEEIAAAAAADAAAPAGGAAEGSKAAEKSKKQIFLERESDKAFVTEVQNRIFAWLDARKEDEHELILPECNSFLRLGQCALR